MFLVRTSLKRACHCEKQGGRHSQFLCHFYAACSPQTKVESFMKKLLIFKKFFQTFLQTRYQRYILCHQLGLSLKLEVLFSICFTQFISYRLSFDLEGGTKGKCKITKRFARHDFLYANYTFQTSRTDNKGVNAI